MPVPVTVTVDTADDPPTLTGIWTGARCSTIPDRGGSSPPFTAGGMVTTIEFVFVSVLVPSLFVTVSETE
jgi:hypothetical protein